MKPTHGILALDLGTTTGWAAIRRGSVSSGTQPFKPGRFDGGGMRFLRFRRWMDEIHALTGCTEIVFEEVRRHVGTDAAHCYGGFMATLTSWCEEHRIAYAGVPVGSIKRHATGKGNADKVAMIAAIKAKGYAPKDDNEADAIALLLMRIDGAT